MPWNEEQQTFIIDESELIKICEDCPHFDECHQEPDEYGLCRYEMEGEK